MHVSVSWINQYLRPGDLSAAALERALMDAGFPIESHTDLPGGDVMLDVEITSNRGDCLSVFGLAREAAAKAGRELVPPSFARPVETAGAVHDALRLENRVPDACPLFTARVIRGVKVGPSPEWLVKALESVGQRSINNVVDVTNYINFELGNPCHVFDLAKLAGPALIVREAVANEPLLTLDGKRRTLAVGEIVVADATRAASLAGIMGSGESEVGPATTDIVLEVATWDPVRVRRTARRLQIRTDASYRYERFVDACTLEAAGNRAAALILQVAGGAYCAGVLSAGRALPTRARVHVSAERCTRVLGVAVSGAEVVRILTTLGLRHVPEADRGAELCFEIPPHRSRDLERPIDLVEEVGRIKGLDAVPMLDRVPVVVKTPQASERAIRELAGTLTGQGFFETVTFSFISPTAADAWLPGGLQATAVDRERRPDEPTLRPSIVPSLLACRAANAAAQVSIPGGVRLFELAAVFAQHKASGGDTPRTAEHRNLALLMDVPQAGRTVKFEERQHGLRLLRGVIEALVRATCGGEALDTLTTEAAAPHCAALAADGYARVSLGGYPLGYFGLITPETARDAGIETTVACAELELERLIMNFPPKAGVRPLPMFPSIERDLSAIVAEDVTWARVRGLVDGLRVRAPRLEAVDFVTAYRGKQIGAGKKSLTLRMTFRDAARTLRHEEVDPEVALVMGALTRDLAAEFRTA